MTVTLSFEELRNLQRGLIIDISLRLDFSYYNSLTDISSVLNIKIVPGGSIRDYFPNECCVRSRGTTKYLWVFLPMVNLP